MAETAMAWGDLNLYELPDGGHLWGREVQVLPSGSMLGARGVIHGLVGITAEPVDGSRCQVWPSSPLLIYGVRGSTPDQLRPYQDELAEAFSESRVAQEL